MQLPSKKVQLERLYADLNKKIQEQKQSTTCPPPEEIHPIPDPVTCDFGDRASTYTFSRDHCYRDGAYFGDIVSIHPDAIKVRINGTGNKYLDGQVVTLGIMPKTTSK